MNRLLLCLLFSIISLSGFSQKVYFIYLQTENDQPFYVRLDKSTYSSSASGYLILPKLVDSTYNLTVGFPQNKWPEQKFAVTMNKKDHGYIVKNFGQKGWGLYDLQTLAIQMSSGAAARIENKGSLDKEISPFTDVLAKAADDPSIREMLIPARPEEKGAGTSIKEPEQKEVIADTKKLIEEKPVVKTEPIVVKKEETAVINKEEPIKPLEKPIEKTEVPVAKVEEPKIVNKEEAVTKKEDVIVAEANTYKPSTIIKTSGAAMKDGFSLVFIDQDHKGVNDTISLIIPDPKPVVEQKENPDKEEKKFLDVLPDTIKAVEEKPVAKTQSEKFYHEMNNCPSLARDNDFFKLRKLMAAAEGDDKMITEAKEYYKAKCFTTQQLKNLSALFLSDAGKLDFFIASYYHVSDKSSFITLQSELKEESSVNQFREMFSK